MANVIRTKEYGTTPTDMWGRIGNFQAVEWHPAVASVAPLAEGKRRDITLGDGGHILETLVGQGDMSYTYSIDESPLPVADYEATISVREEGTGSRVEWKASFAPTAPAKKRRKT